ncbi:MAG: IS3 family transposase [Fusobacteriaceae bacterium]
MKISKIYEMHNKIYGAPKIHASLERLEIKCSLKLVQKIMEKLEIKSIVRKNCRRHCIH